MDGSIGEINMDIASLVRASIGWTLLLTVSVVAAVFTVNNQFQTVSAQFRHIEDNFDQKIEAMSDRGCIVYGHPIAK